ncbi:MAG: hypothetical protein JWM27_4732 [Gemmatimonadetes bacterium]|nr:hypothetical protein [Gemmatimonadota bacterium]
MSKSTPNEIPAPAAPIHIPPALARRIAEREALEQAGAGAAPSTTARDGAPPTSKPKGGG